MTRIAGTAAAAEKTLHVAVAATLFAMMVVTFVDVAGRFFFDRPLPAAYEMTELLMAIAIFGAMPFATRSQGHITITLLDRLFRERAMRIRTVVVSLICAAASFALSYEVFHRSLRLIDQGDHTLFLKAPLAPFALFIAAMSAVTGVCFLLVATGRAIARPAEPGEDQTT